MYIRRCLILKWKYYVTFWQGTRTSMDFDSWGKNANLNKMRHEMTSCTQITACWASVRHTTCLPPFHYCGVCGSVGSLIPLGSLSEPWWGVVELWSSRAGSMTDHSLLREQDEQKQAEFTAPGISWSSGLASWLWRYWRRLWHSYLPSALKQDTSWDSLGCFWEFLALIGYVEKKQKQEQK